MNARSKIKEDNFRINVLNIVFLCAALLFIVRLFTIQVLGHEKYKALAQGQYWDFQNLPARRGDILSSDGFTLAGTQTHYLLYAEPNKIKDKDKFADRLAEVIVKIKNVEELKKEQRFYEIKGSIYKSITPTLFWVALIRNLTPPEKEQIEKEKIEGLGFEEEPVRYYPEGTLNSHVLGFVASNEKGEKQGYYGIEGYFDGDLRGKSGRIIEEKDALGNPILAGAYKKISPINGRNIVLTINRSVQYMVEKRLKEGVEKYDAMAGSVIVMNPLTGEVIAMANYPTFDPSNFNDMSQESTSENKNSNKDTRQKLQRRNISIAETYEPGSVIKALTVSTAIDTNKVKPETTFEDKGPVNYSGYNIDNWNNRHLGTQTVIQLLQKSNNIGAAWVGHQVGSKSIYKYFKKFGLGEKTGIELEGEDTGQLRDYNEWRDIDLATISFGQGISATPLQVLTAFNVIANGGNLVQPKVVTRIIDEDKIIPIPYRSVRRVISEETSETMITMLVSAVDDGESKFFNLKNYQIAGKTGTAQIPVDGKYDPSRTNATFVGFLAGSKKFSMIVRIDRPTSSIYAAETAVPLWMQITEDLVKYYGIPPDKGIYSK